ncbi:PEP-CTERM sorting domain-containing protein [Oxalobacteraceae bacterium]|nr:PEP-CTERM sorting domain-containing protein [Oxalobacteraceae bacterium]
MKKILLTGLAALSIATSAHASLIDASTPIPDDYVLLNLHGAGLDWVYAGPIGPDERGPGQLHGPTYRAAEGWRVATAAEWAHRPLWTDFIKPGNPAAISVPQDGYDDHRGYLFASEYWSIYTHVDLGDYASGYVTDGVNGAGQIVPETIYVRFSTAVPEAQTYAMLLAGLGMLAGLRRRRTKLTNPQ